VRRTYDKKNEEYLRKRGLTRRDFDKGSAGVVLTMMLSAVASALKSVNYVLMSGASEADSLGCVISTHVDDACG
jgi:hypothetical protein